MPHVYNVTDYNELDEWHATRRAAKRAAIDWAHQSNDPDYEVRVVAHGIEPLTRNYACKLLSGTGWATETFTIYTARPRKGRKRNAAE